MNLFQDLRFGARSLFKNPGFTAVAVLTLGLGIGANTAIFSIVYGMMLKPLEYERPNELVNIYSANPSEGWEKADVSIPNYQDWRDQSTSFASLALFEQRSYNLTGGDRPERVRAVYSTANCLPTLGVEPVMGRLFTAEEEVLGQHRVALLFDGFCKRRFGGDPDIVGKTLALDAEDFTIIGVLPAALEKSWGHDDLWIPLGLAPNRFARGSSSFEVMGRLAPGVTAKQAQIELASVASRLEQEYPENKGWTVNIVPIREDMIGVEGQAALYTLMAAVFFILLIACANMANLLLARGSMRQMEVAVRTALGASRWRLVCQMITECLILSVLGGIVGTVLAFWGVDALLAMMPDDVPRKGEIGINETVLWFTLGLSVLSPLLFGLVPALATSSVNLVQTIKDGGCSATAGVSRHLGRDVLVVTQIALALSLVVCAGLMIRSFAKLQKVNPGFETANRLTMRLTLPTYKYETNDARLEFFEQVCREVERTAGVERVAATQSIPMSGSNWWSSVTIEGYDNPDPDQTISVGRLIITPGYFETMGISRRIGRDFTWSDNEDARQVAIVNRHFAEKFWPDQDAVGRRLMWGTHDDPDTEPPWMTVIGVSDDVIHRGMDADVRPEVYEPLMQMPRHEMTFIARTSVDPLVAIAGVENAVWRIDPDQAIYSLRTMEEIIFEDIGSWDAFRRVLGVLAAIALFLAAVGLYGLMAFVVSKRTQEFGVRLAIGAEARDLLQLVLRRVLVLTTLGVVVGIGLAMGLGTLMQVVLYDLSGWDPVTFIVVVGVLFAVSLAASYVPVRRAMGVDPMTALRYE